MNREIKFRAWEKETEMGKAGSMSYNQDFCYCQIRTNDGVEIMQYTGLKDKNGKEIYEGDILFDANGDKRVIKYIEGSFCFSLPNEDRYLSAEGYREIIGNVWETPELLK